MISLRTFLNFLGWHIFHPLEIIYLPKWFKEYKKSTLSTAQPWSNYHFIDYLKKNLTKNDSVLEFGCGGSTVFFSKLVGAITSIEHNKKWVSEVKRRVGGNCRVLLKSETNYLDISGKYDIIFIDGIRRLDCTKKSLSLLKKGGKIIIDDANFMDKGISSCKYLEERGMKSISFKGIKSNDFNVWETRVFYF